MRVFFYGLFMDKALLAERGIVPSASELGHVDGFQLRIGERATLLRQEGARSYGVLMEIGSQEADDLYSESSVKDYVPETVIVGLNDGSSVDAICYNLPADKVAGTNRAYAESLLRVATGLGFPEAYLEQINSA